MISRTGRSRSFRLKRLSPALFALMFSSFPFAVAAQMPAPVPLMAIIIDDLGNRYEEGLRAVQLPGPVTCSVLPGTPFGKTLAVKAHELGKQVMLHLPLAAEAGEKLEPGGVPLDASKKTLQRIVESNLDWLPFVEGVNNHRGSLLTRHPGHMTWLMDILSQRGLFFVDSRTTPHTVALQLAGEHKVNATRRDIFLDHELQADAIRSALDDAVDFAHDHGSVVVIAHPHAVTLAILERVLPRLAAKGVELVKVTDVISVRQEDAWNLARASRQREREISR